VYWDVLVPDIKSGWFFFYLPIIGSTLFEFAHTISLVMVYAG